MVKAYRPRHAYPEFAEPTREMYTARALRRISREEEAERLDTCPEPYEPPTAPPPGWPVE